MAGTCAFERPRLGVQCQVQMRCERREPGKKLGLLRQMVGYGGASGRVTQTSSWGSSDSVLWTAEAA